MVDYLEFKIYWKDEEIQHIRVVNDVVELCTLEDAGKLDIYKRGFPENSNLVTILEFLEDRCFEENRDDMPIILNELGMKEYNSMEMVRKLHGRVQSDFMWVKFKDNGVWEDLSWNMFPKV